MLNSLIGIIAGSTVAPATFNVDYLVIAGGGGGGSSNNSGGGGAGGYLTNTLTALSRSTNYTVTVERKPPAPPPAPLFAPPAAPPATTR